MTARIGEMARAVGAVSAEQLRHAHELQKRNGGRLGVLLVSLGYLSETQVADLVAQQYGLAAVDLDAIEVRSPVVGLVPREFCVKHFVVPLSRRGASLHVAMADPTNVFAVDQVQFVTGLKVVPVVAAEGAILRAIDRLYGQEKGLRPVDAPRSRVRTTTETAEQPGAELNPTDIALGERETDPEVFAEDEAEVEQVQMGPEEIDIASLTGGSTDRPVVDLVNRILVEAYRRGASDIHVEPYEKEFCVRFRVDGLLTEYRGLSPRVRETVTARIKIMANLDIAERRLPQGGRIKIRFRLDDRVRDLDFRVSCLPTLWNEKIVLRLLDKTKLMLDMTGLGFELAEATLTPDVRVGPAHCNRTAAGVPRSR